MLEPYKDSRIFEYSIAQVLVWLNKEFARFSGSELKAAKVVTSPNALRQLSAELSNPSDGTPKYAELQYPYVLYTLGDMSLDTTKGGFNKRAYRNIVFSKDIDAGKANAYDLRPVIVGLGLVFNTDDYAQFIAFAKSLLFHAPKVGFIMEVIDTDFRIETSIDIDPSVSAPPVNYETPGDAYQFNAIITLHTYFGIAKQIPLIREIKFSTIHQSRLEPFYQGSGEKLVQNTIKFSDFYNKNASPYGD